MAEMGYGYGSECHLVRWMGRHRNRLDEYVLRALGRADGPIHWLDSRFKPGSIWPDAEWKGLDFLIDDKALQDKWKDFWPTGKGIHNWDAVAWIDAGADRREWLLVEAKGHTGELNSDCGAKDANSIETICAAFTKTKQFLDVPDSVDWMSEYYQYANRLAALYFLRSEGIAANLLFIYFVGDLVRADRDCPQDREGWDGPLRRQQEHLGLPERHRLSGHIHKLFLHICREQYWIE